MKVNVISESQYFKEKFGGIHSSFINHVALLRKNGISVVINSSQKADIIHFHTYGPFALFKLLFSAEPKVIITHNVPQSFIGSLKGASVLLGWITVYLRFFYNKTDLVIALNTKTKSDLEKMGVTTKIVVLSNPLNTDLFYTDAQLREKGRNKYAIEKNTFVIVGVGKQIPRKGIVDFLLLARKFPACVFVWVGGKDVAVLSPKTTQLQELMDNLPQNVIFTGSIPYEKMSIVYNMSDVFLFPSYQETQGLVVIEAAACNLPLVLKDLPEYRLLYKEGYIACQTVEQFSAAIEKLTTDKEFYEKNKLMSSRLCAKFDADTIIHKMIEYYLVLLKNKKQ